MILEDRNLQIYGYTSNELLPSSEKPIAVMCNECGNERIISKKSNSRAKNQDQLCQSCRSMENKSRTGQKQSAEEKAKRAKALIGNKSRTGQTISNEEREKRSKSLMGNKNALGSKLTPEQSKRRSAGLQHQDYDAGEWTGWADKSQPHLTPIYKCSQLNKRFIGSVGHHISHDTVVFIPKELHEHFYHNMKTGRGMLEMNVLALQFLYGEYITKEGLFAQRCAFINRVNCWDISSETISSQACPVTDLKVQRLTPDTYQRCVMETRAPYIQMDDDIVRACG